MNFKKHIYILGILSLGVLLGALFMFAARQFDDEWTARFQSDYRIYSVPIPQMVEFAGEQIALDNEDIIERYDRELLTNIYWQSQTILFVKRAAKFFPIIEPILKNNKIPDDFKYLCVAESGLQAQVVSPSGAAGYWQFLDKTGKTFGLTVNEEVDERYHLERATEAACRYFNQAYRVFGNWGLVAASYNMGIEGVKKQLQNQETYTYEHLYLNQETSRYLMRIVAIKNILKKPDKFGFHIPQSHHYQKEQTTKIELDTTIESLMDFCTQYGCAYKDLKYYNPWLRKPQLTNPARLVYYIELPQKKVIATTRNSNDTIRHIAPMQDIVEIIHTVGRGETMQSISLQYNVPVLEIRKWNRLVNDNIKPGMSLKIRKTKLE